MKREEKRKKGRGSTSPIFQFTKGTVQDAAPVMERVTRLNRTLKVSQSIEASTWAEKNKSKERKRKKRRRKNKRKKRKEERKRKKRKKTEGRQSDSLESNSESIPIYRSVHLG